MKASFFVFVAAESLDQRDCAEHLTGTGGHSAFLLALLDDRLAHPPVQRVSDEHQQRQRCHDDQRQTPVQPEHHAQHASEQQQVRDQGQRPLGKQVAQLARVGRQLGQQFPAALLVMKAERKLLQAREQLAPQLVYQLVTDTRGQVRLQIAAGPAEQRDQQDHAGHREQRRPMPEFDQRGKHTQLLRQRLRQKDVIEDDFQRPRRDQLRRNHAKQRQTGKRQFPAANPQVPANQPPQFDLSAGAHWGTLGTARQAHWTTLLSLRDGGSALHSRPVPQARTVLRETPAPPRGRKRPFGRPGGALMPPPQRRTNRFRASAVRAPVRSLRESA